MHKIPSSDITPEHIYRSRRRFLRGIGALAIAGLGVAACGNTADPPPARTPGPVSRQSDEFGDPLNTYEQITTYNNFYEFTTSKEGVAQLSRNFRTTPWAIDIGGLVHKPQTIAIEDILKRYPSEERIYRLRCVEGWSMVIPWLGFPLRNLLADVEPMSEARYVRFETLYDPEQMPGQRDRWYNWPYVEGLRLDE
ncbi:protein-methionine-sulfoxide reductase catalytic subunit MsrP, partial [Roseiflexus sp.]